MSPKIAKALESIWEINMKHRKIGIRKQPVTEYYKLPRAKTALHQQVYTSSLPTAKKNSRRIIKKKKNVIKSRQLLK